MKKKNPWDKLTKTFDTTSKEKLETYAADNVEMVWPIIFKKIQKYFKKDSKILDFGCGTGGFCNKLNKEGYCNIWEIDSSEEMIRIAKKFYKEPSFIIGNETKLKKFPEFFDSIICIMVTQFIENFEQLLKHLNHALKPQGKLFIINLNPEFVNECKKQNKLFKETNKKQKEFDLEFSKNNIVKIYVRNKTDHKRALKKEMFKFNSLIKPSFPKKFVQKYKWKLPSHIPEYIIMEFTKK